MKAQIFAATLMLFSVNTFAQNLLDCQIMDVPGHVLDASWGEEYPTISATETEIRIGNTKWGNRPEEVVRNESDVQSVKISARSQEGPGKMLIVVDRASKAGKIVYNSDIAPEITEVATLKCD